MWSTAPPYWPATTTSICLTNASCARLTASPPIWATVTFSLQIGHICDAKRTWIEASSSSSQKQKLSTTDPLVFSAHGTITVLYLKWFSSALEFSLPQRDWFHYTRQPRLGNDQSSSSLVELLKQVPTDQRVTTGLFLHSNEFHSSLCLPLTWSLYQIYIYEKIVHCCRCWPPTHALLFVNRTAVLCLLLFYPSDFHRSSYHQQSTGRGYKNDSSFLPKTLIFRLSSLKIFVLQSEAYRRIRWVIQTFLLATKHL